LAKICPHQIFACLPAGRPSKASAVLARQTPKTPRALVPLRRMRGVNEPGAVRPNIYASMRLARTQARLPLGRYSTLATLQGCGRWAAELLKGFILRGSLEIGSDFLVKGPQTFFFKFGKDFKSATVRNIKGCVGNFSIRACFFKKIGQFFGRARRSDVILKPTHSIGVRKF